MKITRSIFDYWLHHMGLSDDLVKWGDSVSQEGLFFFNGYVMTFWYVLNHEWYKMNDRQFAFTGCKDRYNEPIDILENVKNSLIAGPQAKVEL